MKKYNRINLLFFIAFFIQMGCFSTVSMAQDGRSLLKKALESSKKASFIAIMKNPFPNVTHEQDILPHATLWKFYRCFSGGNVYLRLETSAGGKAIEAYLSNETGVYGVAADGFSAEIIEVPMLWFPELTHLDISAEEIELSSYSVHTDNYNNAPCYRIIMRTPKNDAELMKITDDGEEQYQANRKRYLEKRVFTREFWVGRENNFIYFRKHYNSNGKLIFSVELGNVEFNPSFSPALFATPKDVRGKFIERKFFASRSLGEMIASRKISFRTKFCDWTTSFWQDHFDTIIRWLSRVMAVIGIGIFILVICLKIRARYAGKGNYGAK